MRWLTHVVEEPCTLKYSFEGVILRSSACHSTKKRISIPSSLEFEVTDDALLADWFDGFFATSIICRILGPVSSLWRFEKIVGLVSRHGENSFLALA